MPNQLNQTLTKITAFAQAGNILEFETAEAKAKITVFDANCVEIKVIKQSSVFENFSYSLVVEPKDIPFELLETENNYQLKTSKIYLIIQKNPFRLTFQAIDGTLLNQDDESFGISWIGSEVTNYKKLQEGERFIGLGEKTGNLDKRGNTYTHWNSDAFGYGEWSDPLYCSTPFYMGLVKEKAYGIFLDNTYQTKINFGASSNRFSYFQAPDGELRYYFFHDDSVAKIIEAYTHLTGRIQMPPLWSLGFQQARYSYYPESEVLTLAETFRRKDIPADVIYLDIHYMERYKVFTWDNQRFPNPAELVQKLNTMGFHVALIFDPGVKVEEGYEAYHSGLENEIFAKYPDGEPYTGQVWPGWCHFPDFTNPKTREWWSEYFEELAEIGIEGFWNDMNEPAVWGKHFPDLVEFDFEGEKSTHKKAHNIYGMQMARATFEGAKKYLNKKRPFILTRAGFSGVQRYSAVWTGDNVSNKDNMMTDIRLINSMGLTGMAFAGYDVGGFIGDVSVGLFNRWIEIGAFSPFFRCHTMINSKDAEPWAFGEETEEIARNYIKLRYRLLPYIYATFFEATQTGMPIQRSLAISHTFDAKIYEGHLQNQYFFGDSILVCPMTDEHPINKIYLPKGAWYDLFNDTYLEGNQEIIIETPKDKLPLYVQAGKMLFMQSVVSHTLQSPSEILELHLYKGEEGSAFVYYEDDGLTYNFEQGDFYKRAITYLPEENLIRFGAKEGAYTSKFTQLKIYLHGFTRPDLEKENYRFIEPISNFDPWEHTEDLSKIVFDLPFMLVDWKEEGFEISLLD